MNHTVWPEVSTIGLEDADTQILKELDDGTRDPADKFPLMHLDYMAALLGSVASIARIEADQRETSSPGVQLTLAEIEPLARFCYLQYDWGWRALRLFDWLAAFLARRGGVKGLTGTMLLAAAEKANGGAKFTLPDLS